MITEDFVSYKVAKLLKEKGFKESTRFVWYEHLPSQNAVYNSEIGKPKRDYFYWEKEGERNSLWTNESPVPSYISGEVYSCPTLQMIMKWLREKGFHINVSISYDYSVDADGNVVDKWTFWLFEILSSFSGNLIYTEEVNEYDSYEEAVDAAIKYCLENLI